MRSSVFTGYGKKMLSFILLFFPFYAIASDPRGLFWPVVIGLTLLGVFIFGISAALIIHWIANKFQRCILVGFFFGLFVGPISIPGGLFIPNIANLFTSTGGKGLFYSFVIACIYAIVIFVLFYAFTKMKRIH